MTNEEHLEEILFKAHELGIIKDLTDGVKCNEIDSFRNEIIKKFNEIMENRSQKSQV